MNGARLQIEEHDEESGISRNLEFDPGLDEVRVGRDPGNDLVLASPSASRRHCAFRRQPDGWVVVDLGSSLGTQWNGETLVPNEPRALASGDTVVCSSHRLRITLQAAAEATLSRDPEALSRLVEAVGTEEPRVPRLWLFAEGGGEPQAFPLVDEGAVLTTGRSAECDLRLGDPFRVVSAVHARFERNWAGVYLFDASINGVFVNGVRVVGQTQLRDGDRITIAAEAESSDRPLLVFADAHNEAVPAGPRGAPVLSGRPPVAPEGTPREAAPERGTAPAPTPASSAAPSPGPVVEPPASPAGPTSPAGPRTRVPGTEGASLEPFVGARSGRRVNWILVAVISVSVLALATVLVWGLVLLRGS